MQVSTQLCPRTPMRSRCPPPAVCPTLTVPPPILPPSGLMIATTRWGKPPNFIRQSQHIIIQGVEYLQDHSAIMGSVTLAAAITMVRTSGYVSQKTCVVTYKRHQIFLRKYGDRYIFKLDLKKNSECQKDYWGLWKFNNYFRYIHVLLQYLEHSTVHSTLF